MFRAIEFYLTLVLLLLDPLYLSILYKFDSGYNMKSISAALFGWMIVCAGEAAVAKAAEIYFEHELQAETPITSSGVYELKRLGILTIAFSAGSAVFIEIMFIVMSIFCKYGVEIIEDRKMIQP